MKKVPDADLPELLRKRILRQRKRLKFVRISFAFTAVISVVLLFAANQTQTLAPTARKITIIAPQPLYFVDQHLDIANEAQAPAGTFALVRADGEALAASTRYDGLVRSVTSLKDGAVGITTPSRYLVFDCEGARTEIQSLGINDQSASPVVVNLEGTLWLCWLRGADVLVQPFGREEVEAKSVHKTPSVGAELQAHTGGNHIWLSILEETSGDVTLISFVPSVEAAKPADADRDADGAERLH